MIRIDSKDFSILRALDDDARASFAQIGRKIGLSKEVVQYRMKNLEKWGVITGYWGIPHIGKRNKVYKLLLKNKSLGKELKEEFIRFILSQKAVSWFAETRGNFDFVISSYVEDDEKFSLFVMELMRRFGTHLKEKHLLKSTSMIMMNEKYLYDNDWLKMTKEDSFVSNIANPDKNDLRMMVELAKNARISFTELGRKMGLSSQAVSIRFRNLLTKNLIVALKPRIDHEKIGFSYYHLFLSLSDFDKLDSICSYYIQHPSCVFIMKHIGCFDMHLELVAKEHEISRIIDELTGTFGEYLSSYELLNIQKEHIMIVMR